MNNLGNKVIYQILKIFMTQMMVSATRGIIEKSTISKAKCRLHLF